MDVSLVAELRPRFAGRKVVLTGGPLAALTGVCRRLRELGAERPFLLATGMGTGEVPDPEEAEWCVVEVRAPDVVAEIRAATDALTGLPNNRAVQDTLKRMVAQASRSVAPLSAALLDLDHFKHINDAHGHSRGDEALAAVAANLRSSLRESDFVGRYGGEEFLLLLPDTGKQQARVVAEKVRAAVDAIALSNLDLRVTASFGVATLPDDCGDADSLMRAADRVLYSAKGRGRNRVELFESREDTAPAPALSMAVANPSSTPGQPAS